MKASLKNYHQSPRKVRLVANAIRGKSVPQAQRALMFMPKYAASAIEKLLDSAVANARSSALVPEELFIKMIAVNKGVVSKRGRPFARGRSGVIRKIMSHVTLELGQRAAPAKPARTAGVAQSGGKAPRAKKTAAAKK